MIKISVIIPIYKVENYLDECVQSVFNQTYTQLEIILVDDGSPDNCPAMCNKYAMQDKRVKVIHKENGGLSDARNAGLKIATGEYVIFLDSDDYWLDNEFVNELVYPSLTDEKPDIILFEYTNDNTKLNSSVFDFSAVNCMDRNAAFEYLLLSNKLYPAAWLKLIKRELLLKNNIFFIKGKLGEDMDWSINLWLHVEKCYGVNKIGYFYRQRSMSITSSYSLKNVRDFVETIEDWMIRIRKVNEDLQFEKLLLGYLAHLIPNLVRNYYLISLENRKEEYRLLKKITPLIEYSLTKKSYQLKKIHNFFGFKFTCVFLGIISLFRKKGLKGFIFIFR